MGSYQGPGRCSVIITRMLVNIVHRRGCTDLGQSMGTLRLLAPYSHVHGGSVLAVYMCAAHVIGGLLRQTLTKEA